MALVTIINMYQSVLKGIRKKRTAALWPADYNILINEAYQEWLRDKVKEADMTQQRMDDLNRLRYITDSSIEVLVSSNTIDVVGGEVASDTFDSVTGLRTIVTIDVAPDPDTVTTTIYQRLIPIKPITGNDKMYEVLPTNYPDYYRLQSIQVNVIMSGVTYGPIGSKPMRADRKSEIMKDPYSKPYLDIVNYERSRVYHQYIQDRLHLILPDDVTGQDILIEYIKKPLDLYYDANDSTNNVDCELDSDQQQQIVDIAIRMFVESVESKRYQSVLAEEQIKQPSK